MSGTIKKGWMRKRARGRSSVGKTNWKERWFELDSKELSYWDKYGGQKEGGNKKGTISLEFVQSATAVDPDEHRRDHVFQINYTENGTKQLQLVIQGADDSERDAWIDVITLALTPTRPHQDSGISTDRGSRMSPELTPKQTPDKQTTPLPQRPTPTPTPTPTPVSKPTPVTKPTPTPTPTPTSTSAPTPRTSSPAIQQIQQPIPAKRPVSSRRSLETPSPSTDMPNTSTPTPHPVVPVIVRKAPQRVNPLTAMTPNLPVPTPPSPQPTQPLQPGVEQAKFAVVAMHAYTPASVKDLSLTKGEILDVLEDTEPNWWKARNKAGQVGFIPYNYVKKEGLASKPWFHGKMGRTEAGSILRMANASGTFLIRESESKQGQYSLSLSHESIIKHYHLRSLGGELFINERHRFPTLEALVEYHRLNSGGLITRLRNTVAEAQAPPTAGFSHGQWEIDRKHITLTKSIGEGNFGKVSLGVYTVSNALVAVKMLKQENRIMEEDFISEAKVMMELSHDHLVQLYGVCLESPMYLITEFMSNGCLLDYLRDEPTLEPHVLHLMCIHVALGMSYLEEKNYIHRDLAARNCLVGENNMVKVGDFGLARFVLDDEYTASEGTKYPVKWAALEVINYNRFSIRSDVWSFGILMWEIWSRGCKPYPGMDNVRVMKEVTNNYRLPKPDLSTDDIHSIMMQCWHADPDQRPSFSDLIQKLNETHSEYVDEEEFSTILSQLNDEAT